MCLQLYIVARSHDYCCHESVTKSYITSIFVGVDVAVNNREVVSVVMEMHQGVPFALLPSYDVLLTAVNNYTYYVL
jgi:hypothetical protein